ncbi:sulfite exporter TauE/SafE family protein [Shewanella intestini]|uniref:Probable membrane transporter protein n=1 Tax=Shewanella intestini TaxID=2017544 RepID=A0ABS5I209_9GAMM|nr:MULTISPECIES: sulfite exporter TauE/SafE family protein [Shewanella]MBR9728047.1 sulfite exporter TauE/SafE family protein [Shewanella intestini]
MWFYITAIPAVFFYGMGKGGIGGILGMLSVPLMALTVPPIKAAGILLPLLCVMDVIAYYYHRKNCNYTILKSMLPMALAGIAIAAYFMGSMPSNVVELLIGGLAMAFLAQTFLIKSTKVDNPIKGHLLNALSGFASTIAHAGGPPVSMFLLPKKLPKEQLIGTGVVFFLVLNFTKLIPYAYVGELEFENLITSAILLPVAFLGVRVGVLLVNIISQEMIYKISYIVLFFAGCKMLYSGIVGF